MTDFRPSAGVGHSGELALFGLPAAPCECLSFCLTAVTARATSRFATGSLSIQKPRLARDRRKLERAGPSRRACASLLLLRTLLNHWRDQVEAKICWKIKKNNNKNTQAQCRMTRRNHQMALWAALTFRDLELVVLLVPQTTSLVVQDLDGILRVGTVGGPQSKVGSYWWGGGRVLNISVTKCALFLHFE